ncbi:MAG: hypothetical protein QOF72_1282 [Blastocatellia bacterium]|jgi:hypothetical protein|nr:hypothetical protein [Blastocatellia bacterium]
MLKEDEKKLIYLQEQYRLEVKRQLESDEPRKRNSIWGFVNSAFFLWFMSSVVIGAVSLWYTRWDKNKEDGRRLYEQEQTIKHEREAAIKKLDAELSSRLNYLAHPSYPNMRMPTVQRVLKDTLRAVNKPSETDEPINVFPEYANRNFQSLIWELLQLAPEEEKKQLVKAYQAAYWLPSGISNLPLLPRDDPPDPSRVPSHISEEEVFSRLELASLDLRRWGSPFTSSANDDLLPDYQYLYIHHGAVDAGMITIREAKEILKSGHYYDGEINDLNDKDFIEAVKKFQRAKNMNNADGVLGPYTLRELKPQ